MVHVDGECPPDSSLLPRRSKTVYIATCLSVSGALWELIALCTPCWIEADRRLYNNQFDKLGLLVFCFRSFTDPKRRYSQYFVSCRWFFDYEWKYMYDILAPQFFRSVQVAFGIAFILLLISLGELALFWMRTYAKRELSLLFILSFTHAAAAFWFFLAYTIFGANAYDINWLPGWKNNYLSWSFALSVIGGMKLFVSSILYFIAAKRNLDTAIATTEAELMASMAVMQPLTSRRPQSLNSPPPIIRQSLV